MLFIYDSRMPLRIMEEIRYWKMEEKEHTQLIRQLAPELENEYTVLFREWEQAFTQTEDAANRWVQLLLNEEQNNASKQTEQMETFVRVTIQQSQQFIQHLHRLHGESKEMRINKQASIGLLHTIRESEYFIGIMNALLASDRSPFEQSNSTPKSMRAVRLRRKASDTNDTTDMNNTNNTNNTTGSNITTETTGMSNSHDSNGANSSSFNTSDASQQPVPIGKHKLPPLPYRYDALEPHIDEQTMKLHHDVHHQSYVDGLNTAEKMMKTARETNDFALLKHWEKEAAFHGAGHYLHTIFWNVMSPAGGGKATGAIAAQIDRDFGSFERFKAHFSNAAEKVEGGGWAILVWSPRSHRLEILQAEKHQNLSQWDVIPLLALDVWEHAYYLKYKNDRKKYIQAWWNTVNWHHVNERFAAARRLKWTPY